MSKTLKKKKHWSSKVQECAVSWGTGGEFSSVVEVRGGAEHGEFPYLGQVKSEAMVCQYGRVPIPGDVLLEVNGTPVSGLTNRDTLAVIRHFREPIRLKTVKPEVGQPITLSFILEDSEKDEEVDMNTPLSKFTCLPPLAVVHSPVSHPRPGPVWKQHVAGCLKPRGLEHVGSVTRPCVMASCLIHASSIIDELRECKRSHSPRDSAPTRKLRRCKCRWESRDDITKASTRCLPERRFSRSSPPPISPTLFRESLRLTVHRLENGTKQACGVVRP
ncbi:hypothetical protein AGOR_G00154820 [Albula goreensis]|uniref:PDZ domain-containing protein n=1 Tax=Albula goreensis TaxID=1534307 RepID=A0A8T3D751_9TELE|nr:hypothetical protein AGOR_G00154820 [Albula goreensis]